MRPIRKFLVVLVALAVLGSACGSDSSGRAKSAKPSTSAKPSSGGTRGVTADEILVGGVAQTQLYSGLESGVKARFERANREGGVHGRRLRFLGTQDDASDASKDLALVKSLVLNDKVFAVLPVLSDKFLPQSSDFLDQNEVPFLGWGFMPGFCGSEWGAGFNGCLSNTDVANSSSVEPAIKASGKDAGDLRIAVQQQDGPAATAALKQYDTLAKELGFDLVYSRHDIPIGQGTVDYSPFVQAILATKPDIVFVNVDFATEVALRAALVAAGYKGMTVGFTTYVPGLLEAQPNLAAALDGHYVMTQVPPQEGGSAAVKQIEDDLKAIDEKPFVTLGAAVGYWVADVFIAMLDATGKDLTPATFHAAVRDGHFEYQPEADGAIGPVSFPKASTEPVPCSSLLRVDGTAFKVEVPFACYRNVPQG